MFIKNHKQKVLLKFVLLLAVLVCYFAYLSFKFDIVTGGIASLLTWSFFVLCTPVADAGFLLDFPIRLIVGIRMVFSEIAVWVIAIIINVICLLYYPDYYATTKLTHIFKAILTNPFPYWGVIVLSAVGTFLSIRFGDELMDVIHHKDRHFFHAHGFKHNLLIMVIALIMVVIIYYELLEHLDINVGGVV